MSKGFTFIEIIIVIAIIGIMTAVGVGSYSNQAQNQALKSDAQQFADDIALTRQMILSRDTQGTICTLTGFQIAVDRTNQRYVLSRSCQGNPDVEVKRVDFRSSNIRTNPCCTFSVSYPYASITTTTSTFQLQHRGKQDKCITITVDAYQPVQISDVIPCT